MIGRFGSFKILSLNVNFINVIIINIVTLDSISIQTLFVKFLIFLKILFSFFSAHHYIAVLYCHNYVSYTKALLYLYSHRRKILCVWLYNLSQSIPFYVLNFQQENSIQRKKSIILKLLFVKQSCVYKLAINYKPLNTQKFHSLKSLKIHYCSTLGLAF